MTRGSPPESAADRRIRAEVLVRLAADTEVRDADIHVSVDEGVVKLTGMINGIRERIAASDAALGVDGVSAVIDELTERESQRADQ